MYDIRTVLIITKEKQIQNNNNITHKIQERFFKYKEKYQLSLLALQCQLSTEQIGSYRIASNLCIKGRGTSMPCNLVLDIFLSITNKTFKECDS